MLGITAQSFSLRDAFEIDFEGTIQFLKEQGLTALEPILLFGHEQEKMKEAIDQMASYFNGKMPACVWTSDLAAEKISQVRQLGLEVESVHLFLTDAYDTLLESLTPDLIAFGIENGIKHFGVSYMLKDKDMADLFIPRLLKVSQAFADADMYFAYHNHNMELNDIGGVSVLEYVLDAVPTLQLQPDIGWIEAGGGSISKIFDKYYDRIHSIHFKDMILNPKPEGMNIVCTPVGSGDVESKAIIPYLKRCPLMPHGLVIDQDNAKTNMLDEMVEGYKFIKSIC